MSDPVPVSVIIPCYNCASSIDRAVDSVLSQKTPPMEIILVDDASVDGGSTRLAIEGLFARCSSLEVVLRVIWLEENVGPAGARNAGWELAKGDYIAFLDADDAWHPRKLELQYLWMNTHRSCTGSGHGTLFVQEGAPPDVSMAPDFNASTVRLGSMLFSNRLRTRTVMLRRDIEERFPSQRRYAEDYALWLRLAAGNHELFVIDADLAFSFRPEFSDGGQSSHLWSMERAELSIFVEMMVEGRIGFMPAVAASVVSLIKYSRRLFIRAIRVFSY